MSIFSKPFSKYSELVDGLDQKTATAERQIASANAKIQAAEAERVAWNAKTDPGSHPGKDSEDGDGIADRIDAAKSAEVRAQKEFAVAVVKSTFVGAPLKVARGVRNLLNPAR